MTNKYINSNLSR